jgi:DNA mismatch repair ATPase MutS
MNDRISFYEQRVNQLIQELATLNYQLRQISRSRLAFFLLIVASIAASAWLSSLLIITTFAFIALFGIQVKRHAVTSGEVALCEKILKLNEDELAFMRGNKSVFQQGDMQLAGDHIYAIDLDIFGKGSLFQAIDRTGTWEGRGLVMDTLLRLPKDISIIERRKEALAELENEVEWRQRFNVVGQLAEETPGDMPALRKWVDQPDFFQGRAWWIWVARIVSAISVALIAWMFIAQTFYALAFFGWLIFNSIIRGILEREMKSYFNSFGSRTKLFQKFSDLFVLVSRKQFKSSLVKEHYENVNQAAGAFMELSRLANRVDQRLNGLVGPLMNGLFLFDVWNVHAIESWRIKHRSEVDSWIIALANIDMLNSLANYKFNHPAFVDATIMSGPSQVIARSMGHPLLPFNESVKNDYELGITSKAHIVTGSNMAGKSTFIRTVGLNIILALNGMPVCAESFTCTVLSIASCIRITDSLEEHASYFRAELIRLEHVVQMLKTGEPYIVLLDEILRGTNSDDKRMGTLAFFKKLKDYNCVAILATHDLVIGKLEEQFPGHYANYCFESELRGSQLHFDYKLRKGVSSSTNATFLMKSLGLID